MNSYYLDSVNLHQETLNFLQISSILLSLITSKKENYFSVGQSALDDSHSSNEW